MRNVFDHTDIARAFRDAILNAGVTETVYLDRPKSAPKKNDYIVLHIAGNIEDMAAYGTATMTVGIFVQDLANQPNTARLSYMYRRLMQRLPNLLERRSGDFDGSDFGRDYSTDSMAYSIIVDNHANVLGDSHDDYGFTARILTIKLTIKII